MPDPDINGDLQISPEQDLATGPRVNTSQALGRVAEHRQPIAMTRGNSGYSVDY